MCELAGQVAACPPLSVCDSSATIQITRMMRALRPCLDPMHIQERYEMLAFCMTRE